MTTRVSLNEAEVKALRDVWRRHCGELNGSERDLLGQVVKKLDRAGDQTWRRFVWMEGDIRVVRRGTGAAEAASSGSPDEHAVRFAEADELMDAIDRIIDLGRD